LAVDFVDDVIAYRKKFPIDYPVLVGEQDGNRCGARFRGCGAGVPFTVFTDAKGRVLTVHVGELHEAEARAILGVVARVDAGALAPPDAREAIRSALARFPKRRTSRGAESRPWALLLRSAAFCVDLRRNSPERPRAETVHLRVHWPTAYAPGGGPMPRILVLTWAET